MYIQSGIIGVIDDPDLFKFLSVDWMVSPMHVVQAPFPQLPTLLAVDPAVDGALTKALNYIAHAPNEILLFAVLKKPDPNLMALATINGAITVITRGLMDQGQEETLAMPILCMRSIILSWKRTALEAIHNRAEDSALVNTSILPHTLSQIASFDPQWDGKQELAFCMDGTWYATEAMHPVEDKDALIKLLETYTTSEFMIASEDFQDGALLFKEILNRGRIRIVLVVWEADIHSIDPWEGVPTLDLYRGYFQRIALALQVPFANAIRDVLFAERIAQRSLLSAFQDTSIGLLDTLASNNPQEPAYVQGKTFYAVKNRAENVDPDAQESLQHILSLEEGREERPENIDLHQIWEVSARNDPQPQQSAFQYDGPQFPYAPLMRNTFLYIFQFFRILSQKQDFKLKLKVKHQIQDGYHLFHFTDNSPILPIQQREYWFEPYAIEAPEIGLFETAINAQRIGGNLSDITDSKKEQHHCLLLRWPQYVQLYEETEHWLYDTRKIREPYIYLHSTGVRDISKADPREPSLRHDPHNPVSRLLHPDLDPLRRL